MAKKKDLTTQKHFLALNKLLVTAEERERAKPKTEEVKD